MRRILRCDGPDQRDGIKIDMRIGPGQDQTGRDHAEKRSSLSGHRPQRLSSPARGQKAEPAIDQKEDHARPAHCIAEPRRPCRQGAEARHANRNQNGIRKRADSHHRAHMFTPQTLPQHEGILRPDGHDQAHRNKISVNGRLDHLALPDPAGRT